jgi:hypothetical protein
MQPLVAFGSKHQAHGNGTNDVVTQRAEGAIEPFGPKLSGRSYLAPSSQRTTIGSQEVVEIASSRRTKDMGRREATWDDCDRGNALLPIQLNPSLRTWRGSVGRGQSIHV